MSSVASIDHTIIEAHPIDRIVNVVLVRSFVQRSNQAYTWSEGKARGQADSSGNVSVFGSEERKIELSCYVMSTGEDLLLT